MRGVSFHPVPGLCSFLRDSVFVPAEHNPLLDILLARGPSGESPVKSVPRGTRKPTASPVPHAAGTDPKQTEKQTTVVSRNGRERTTASKQKPSSQKGSRSSKKLGKVESDAEEGTDTGSSPFDRFSPPL